MAYFGGIHFSTCEFFAYLNQKKNAVQNQKSVCYYANFTKCGADLETADLFWITEEIVNCFQYRKNIVTYSHPSFMAIVCPYFFPHLPTPSKFG